jgi:hypothetical protein
VDCDGWSVTVGIGLLFKDNAFVGPTAAYAAMFGRNADAQKACNINGVK